jgi:hypothetical protein
MNKASATKAKHNPFQQTEKKAGGLEAIRDMNGESLHALVYEASLHAGVVSVGVTRDMGAATLGILIDGEQHREYAKNTEELDSLVATLATWLKSL